MTGRPLGTDTAVGSTVERTCNRAAVALCSDFVRRAPTARGPSRGENEGQKQADHADTIPPLKPSDKPLGHCYLHDDPMGSTTARSRPPPASQVALISSSTTSARIKSQARTAFAASAATQSEHIQMRRYPFRHLASTDYQIPFIQICVRLIPNDAKCRKTACN